MKNLFGTVTMTREQLYDVWVGGVDEAVVSIHVDDNYVALITRLVD